MYEIQICQAHIHSVYVPGYTNKRFFKRNFIYYSLIKTINMAYQTLKNEKKNKNNNNVAWMQTWLGFVNTPHP